MRRLMIIPALAITCAATVAAQGTLASRIAAVRDGVVRMEYPARAGVCGNGRDMVGYRRALFAQSFESWGTWSGVSCVAGPMRVALTRADGTLSRVQVEVGGTWRATDEKVTNLGAVSPTEASAYFFSIIPILESLPEKDRVLLPAVLAADAAVLEPLRALARDESRTLRIRRQAVQWLGLVGDASVVAELTRYARNRDAGEKKSLSGAAMSALGALSDDSGIPALLDLSRDSSIAVRRDAAFWLGQSEDPRASARLHQVIENRGEEGRVRAHAIFSLANGSARTSSREFRYLRDVYPSLESDQLKDAIFQGMAQDADNGSRWLMQRAGDEQESVSARKKALFWAGQSEATSVTDLVGVYRSASDPSLREHAIFVLSQRQESSATDALIAIARDDSDRRMRGKAMFWLAQKKDPRVTKMLSDILVK